MYNSKNASHYYTSEGQKNKTCVAARDVFKKEKTQTRVGDCTKKRSEMPTKNTHPHTKSFSGESGAKVTCLKGNDRLMLFGMCIPLRLSLSKSEQSRFLCVCVYTT